MASSVANAAKLLEKSITSEVRYNQTCRTIGLYQIFALYSIRFGAK